MADKPDGAGPRRRRELGWGQPASMFHAGIEGRLRRVDATARMGQAA